VFASWGSSRGLAEKQKRIVVSAYVSVLWGTSRGFSRKDETFGRSCIGVYVLGQHQWVLKKNRNAWSFLHGRLRHWAVRGGGG